VKPSLPWEINKYYIFVCVCVRARKRACMRMPWRVGVCMLDLVTLLVTPLASPNVSKLSHKRHDLKKKLLNIKCAF
jgi:hypothetical protein